MEINHSFSYTFQPGQGQWSKIGIDLMGLDPNIPIEEQLESIDNVLKVTWPYIKEKVDAQVEEIITMANEEK